MGPHDPQTALAGCYKATASTWPAEPLHCVFEPLIYGGCLPREKNVIGHFFGGCKDYFLMKTHTKKGLQAALKVGR